MSDPNVQRPAPGIDQRRLTVLLVEDEVLIRLVAADVLRDAGHAVVEAATGEEAVSLLAAGVDIDLVVSDLRMPGAVDGLQLAAFVRAQRPDIPVLLATSHWPGQEPPPLDLLLKPYSSDELLAAIARAAAEERNA